MYEDNKKNLSPDLYARNTLIGSLIQKLTRWPTPRILDVGGFGGQLERFLPENARLTVVDRKPAPKKTEQGAVEPKYIQADGRKLPFSDNNFDIVVGSDLIEHVAAEDRSKIISEMLRVAKSYLILGIPTINNLTETTENLIREQYQLNAGTKHPFLSEHQELGLPAEQNIEAVLQERGAKFFKLKQGNLMNWYIQQLYSGTKIGELIGNNVQKFNEFCNEKLFELGDLRTPTYRTIYCIAKGNNELASEETIKEIEQKYLWSAETFMNLLRLAFDDIRGVINQRKLQIDLKEKELLLTHNHNRNLENTVAIAKKSVTAHRQAITELRNFLEEKEQALNFLKTILHDKDAQIGAMEANNKALTEEFNAQKDFLQKLNADLEKKNADLDLLKNQVVHNEQVLKEKLDIISANESQIGGLKAELTSHQNSLREIMNSRSWKLIMLYGRLKNKLVVTPWRMIKKGFLVLRHYGVKEFMRRLLKKIKRAPQQDGQISPYQIYLTQKAEAENLSEIKKQIAKFTYKPVISIVMPVYNIEEKWLVKAVESVLSQSYDRLELCICDDSSTQYHIKPLLEKYAKKDSRVKVVYRQKNGGIVKASNDALKLATGAYIGLLDNDDEITPNALFEVVKALQETKFDLIYSDEDKLELDGTPCEPFFKPDWSPDLLLSINYISHFGVYRRKLVNEIGGFREGFDGSQDYDLVLRFTEKTQNIKHIPKILYHWRKIPGSTAATVDAKPYAFESAKKALTQALKRRNITGNITDGIWAGSYRVKREISTTPLVSVIIPFKDKSDVTRVCVDSIITKSSYSNYEILLVDNRSEFFETAEYLSSLQDPRIRILKYDQPFNYSAINNFAVNHAKGDVLILLNNDTEILNSDWIEAMLEHALRPEVGAVGAKLLYPNNTIQHAGVLIGVGGIANHAFCKQYKDDHGYFGQVDLIRNCSAVTAACVMVRKDVYMGMNGLDEQNLAVGFNDVDFCLRLREKGYLIVYTPYAQLYHYESLSRGFDVNLKEVSYIEQRHHAILQKGDPYYNPNLTRERFDFSLRVGDKN